MNRKELWTLDESIKSNQYSYDQDDDAEMSEFHILAASCPTNVRQDEAKMHNSHIFDDDK